MNFEQWIKQAYNINIGDGVVYSKDFYLTDMEVAYSAGKKEGEGTFAFMCSSAKLGAFSKHSEYDAVVVDLEKYDRMVEIIEEQQKEIERLKEYEYMYKELE